MSLYSLFYHKLPDNRGCLLPSDVPKMVTFLNTYYMESLYNRIDLYQQFDFICSDGIWPIFLQNIFGLQKSERISFDMSSLAGDVFQYLSQTDTSVYLIGAKKEEINRFIETLKKLYPNIKVAGWHDGYIKGLFERFAKEIIELNPTVVIIGMGAPMQDEFAIVLKKAGYRGTIYTCGGFFHQGKEKLHYYPQWINRWNLRSFYRIYKEPYVLKRVIWSIPLFTIKYSLFLIALKIKKLLSKKQ